MVEKKDFTKYSYVAIVILVLLGLIGLFQIAVFNLWTEPLMVQTVAWFGTAIMFYLISRKGFFDLSKQPPFYKSTKDMDKKEMSKTKKLRFVYLALFLLAIVLVCIGIALFGTAFIFG